MASKLHLVKGIERDARTLTPAGSQQSEEMFRYGAHEEVWEVSCEPEREYSSGPLSFASRGAFSSRGSRRAS